MTNPDTNHMDPAAVSDCYMKSLDSSIKFVSNVSKDA